MQCLVNHLMWHMKWLCTKKHKNDSDRPPQKTKCTGWWIRPQVTYAAKEARGDVIMRKISEPCQTCLLWDISLLGPPASYAFVTCGMQCATRMVPTKVQQTVHMYGTDTKKKSTLASNSKRSGKMWQTCTLSQLSGTLGVHWWLLDLLWCLFLKWDVRPYQKMRFWGG